MGLCRNLMDFDDDDVKDISNTTGVKLIVSASKAQVRHSFFLLKLYLFTQILFVYNFNSKLNKIFKNYCSYFSEFYGAQKKS